VVTVRTPGENNWASRLEGSGLAPSVRAGDEISPPPNVGDSVMEERCGKRSSFSRGQNRF
jgi:hypothetical protein